MQENDVGYQYFVPKLQNKYRSELGALCYLVFCTETREQI
jgi:hypothetical protein